MPERSRWPAPAKLNLFLRVTGRRDDGYHDLQTVFQLIDLTDEIEIAVRDDGRIVRHQGPPGVPPERDLAVRAARLLQAESGVKLGAELTVRKRIPSGAGLGGGSSDAATVLLALNALWSCGLDVNALAALGLSLGADVPVFVHGRSAWAEGVGERLRPMDLGRRHYVLVFPGIEIATADLFADPELERNAPLLAFGGDEWERSGNAFEPVVRARYPELAAVMDDLRSEGVPRLTGTGSCLFIAVRDRMAAESVTQRLSCRYNVCRVMGIDRSPALAERAGG